MINEMSKEIEQLDPLSKRRIAALNTVKNHSMAAGSVGILPVPLVDLAAISAIQLKLVHKLANIYEQPFSKSSGKSIVAALVGGYAPVSFGFGTMGLMLKSIPVVGPLLGVLTVPTFAAASTYAVGKVFIAHFDAGGTILSFDPEKVRDYYNQQMDEGKREVRNSFAGVKP